MNSKYSLPEKKLWNICKAQRKTSIWHFDLLEVAWHQPQTSIVNFNATLMCCVIDQIFDLHRPQLKINNRLYRNVPFSNTLLKISNYFQGMAIVCKIYSCTIVFREGTSNCCVVHNNIGWRVWVRYFIKTFTCVIIDTNSQVTFNVNTYVTGDTFRLNVYCMSPIQVDTIESNYMVIWGKSSTL